MVCIVKSQAFDRTGLGLYAVKEPSPHIGRTRQELESKYLVVIFDQNEYLHMIYKSQS